MLKNGTLVKVDGKESRITSSWCQGKLRVYALEDGRHLPGLGEVHVVEEKQWIKRAKPDPVLTEEDVEDEA